MRIGIFVVDGAFDSGLATLLDVFATANQLRGQVADPPPPWQVATVGLDGEVRTGAGHRVPTTRFEALPGSPDLLIVPALGQKDPAGLTAAVSAQEHAGVLSAITDVYDAGGQAAGACTGTFFLGEAGVLDGQAATTSWWLGPTFRRRYPRVALDESQMMLRSGRLTTAGAAMAHVDLALSVVRDASPAVADLVASYLLIGSRSQQSSFVLPSVLAREDPGLERFETWVRRHLPVPISIAGAARELGMSERSLQRLTGSTIGMSPQEFVNEIRVDHASVLLRTTTLTVDAVAHRVGYRNASTLRNLVQRRRGMTVAQIRAQAAPA